MIVNIYDVNHGFCGYVRDGLTGANILIDCGYDGGSGFHPVDAILSVHGPIGEDSSYRTTTRTTLTVCPIYSGRLVRLPQLSSSAILHSALNNYCHLRPNRTGMAFLLFFA